MRIFVVVYSCATICVFLNKQVTNLVQRHKFPKQYESGGGSISLFKGWIIFCLVL